MLGIDWPKLPPEFSSTNSSNWCTLVSIEDGVSSPLEQTSELVEAFGGTLELEEDFFLMFFDFSADRKLKRGMKKCYSYSNAMLGKHLMLL